MYFDLQYSKSILIKNKKLLKQIVLADITHIVSNTNSCEIYSLTEKFIHHKAKPIKDIEKDLMPYGFIRTNYNVLVNFRHIDFIDPCAKELTLKNATKLQISARRWRTVRATFIKL